ncbi:MAG: TfoX/Sxy family protein [Verrucomicrobia bacterium]|nr:TfoX/Sxy family protein [Verrucomicrobiota bacterium]MBU1910631.1 TfoX/Sxy family protein [Verrucomicrobiota bacterium]
MPVSDECIAYVLDQLSGWDGVIARRMFGGAGLYRQGRMFGLIADDTTYLKVDDSNRQAFLDAGSSAFKPYPNKPAVMSYYEVPADVLERPEELVLWARRSWSIQNSQKKKK